MVKLNRHSQAKDRVFIYLTLQFLLNYRVSQKNGAFVLFEFLGLGGVFLGVKNNSKNFGNKKI